MRRILDAKYKKADLNEFMTDKCQHLNTEEHERLLILLIIIIIFISIT